MQIKINDGCVREAVCHHGVFDTNVNVIQPAESGGKVVGAVMARRADTDESSGGAATKAGPLEDSIHRIQNTSKSPLEGV